MTLCGYAGCQPASPCSWCSVFVADDACPRCGELLEQAGCDVRCAGCLYRDSCPCGKRAA